MSLSNDTITAVPDLRAGHATSDDGATGCTVVLGPFRAAADVRGLATGTRELETLSPLHLVPEAHGIVLSGGSAPGLASADGVSDWLRQKHIGFDAGTVRIPIVPAAVIFDIREAAAPVEWAALGRAACDAASDAPLAQGAVGAGAGATVGKIHGPAHSSPGGLGSCAVRHGAYTVAALAVVNAWGDVTDARGRIVAGARTPDGAWLDTMRAAGDAGGTWPSAAANTTLCIVATDAPLSRTALQLLARAGSAAITRRTSPPNTVFDGDVAFALSSAATVAELSPAELLALSVVAQRLTERAILRAVGHDAPASA